MAKSEYIPCILSVTTIPERVEHFFSAIDCFLSQSVKPEKMIVWLCENYFSEADIEKIRIKFALPAWIELKRVIHLGPHTRVFYAVKKFPDYPIVVADDDMIFPIFWLENLLKKFKNEPEYIHAYYTKTISFDKNLALKPQHEWLSDIHEPSHFHHLLLGVGTIFPPGSFHKDALDLEKIKALAPTSSDTWFTVMAILKGTKVKKMFPESQIFPIIPGTQKKSMWQINSKTIDKQIREIYDYYKIKELLFKQEV
ncbi:MAG: hypothetical protein HQM10_02775 [Candidatus Riflebacteria bacterium]|nr:hypothetical protein [Candidatus Riflebacteria bacterium]